MPQERKINFNFITGLKFETLSNICMYVINIKLHMLIKHLPQTCLNNYSLFLNILLYMYKYILIYVHIKKKKFFLWFARCKVFYVVI